MSVRTPEGNLRRCWRSGFLRLASPLTEEPVPLGVGWLFQDVTEAKQLEQEASLLRFRAQQLHRAARAAPPSARTRATRRPSTSTSPSPASPTMPLSTGSRADR